MAVEYEEVLNRLKSITQNPEDIIEIEYEYRGGKEKLIIVDLDLTYHIDRLIRSGKSGKWIYWQSFFTSTKTDILKYIIDKDPSINLDVFINLKGR